MLEKNFKIDRIKVNILELQIKIMKQIFKSSSNREIIKHLISNDIKDTWEIVCFCSIKSLIELDFDKDVTHTWSLT